MKSVYSSLLLAAIGTATASAGLQREAQASQGLRNQTSAQGFGANKGEQSSGSPNLKPIPGSAVQVASLKPLLSVPGSEASATNTFLSFLSTPSAALTTSAINASASSAARGFFTIGGASSSAVALGQALSTTIAISSTLPVLTSGSPQALETSVAFSNGTTAELTPLGASGSEASIATATATATAGVVGAAESAGTLQPIPGSAVATAALQPLTGAESAATTDATNAAEATPVGNAGDSTTSLKSLGGSDTVISLQALSTVTSITESSGTLTATSTSVRGATTTATNVLSSVTATSTSTATSGGAPTAVMSWTIVGGFAGLVAYLLL